MKRIISNLIKISLSVALLYGCNMSSPEEIVEISETSNTTLSIPAGFDFSTHQKVSINIIENAGYAKYDVYAYYDVSGKTPTEAELSGKLVFSGVPKNGVLKQTINVPSYYTKVFIRRNENQNMSLTAKDIVNKEVNFNSSEAKSTANKTAGKSANIDSDGDGVLDADDAYPDDSLRAFNQYTPSKNSWGTIAFEDLWPSAGDYDFNDVAFQYQTTIQLNADNLAVGFDFKYKIISNNTYGVNGLAFQLDNINSSKIESVTAPVLTRNFINLNVNGTEANQEKAVIILTDDVNNIEHDTIFNADKYFFDFKIQTVSVKFVNPISTSNLGVAPFNPFLILNIDSKYQEYMTPANDPRYPTGMVRKFEVHLPFMSATSYINNSTFSWDNNIFNGTLDGLKQHAANYISENGYPWGIHIIGDFNAPKDKVSIINAYNFFGAWAESGGVNFQDWYTDNPGNRNSGLLE
jgi:LruC domain-containing protein